MTNFSGEAAYLRGGAYFEFHIQQERLIEGGRLFEEIRYIFLLIHFVPFSSKELASEIPNSLVPSEYHIVKNPGVLGLEFHDE